MCDEIEAVIRRRPAVHHLTYGAFLQGPIWVDPQTLVAPMTEMGFEHAALYACHYHRQLLGVEPDRAAVDGLIAQGREALPVLAFITFTEQDRAPQAMEAEALPRFLSAEQLVGWISGDFLHDFAVVVAATDQIYFRTLPPPNRRRLLLGPGNVGQALEDNIRLISELAQNDERFGYALSLYRDALHEGNKQFKIARLFTVLEAFAYALKVGGLGSRDAVRRMLRLEDGAYGQVNHEGRRIRYERISLAGKLRDRLFHGAQFARDDLPAEQREGFDLIAERPDILIAALMSDCEIEIARWGNNTSVGRAAAEARRLN